MPKRLRRDDVYLRPTQLDETSRLNWGAQNFYSLLECRIKRRIYPPSREQSFAYRNGPLLLTDRSHCDSKDEKFSPRELADQIGKSPPMVENLGQLVHIVARIAPLRVRAKKYRTSQIKSFVTNDADR